MFAFIFFISKVGISLISLGFRVPLGKLFRGLVTEQNDNVKYGGKIE